MSQFASPSKLATSTRALRAATALASLLLLALFSLLLVTPSAAGRQSEVIAISIVRAADSNGITVIDPSGVFSGTGKPVMRPNEAKAQDGDQIKICNKTQLVASLFSYSRFNVFGRKAGTGLRIGPGACTTVTVHNPTESPIPVAIFSEIQPSLKLSVTVSPPCPTRSTKAAGKCARKAPATTTPAAGTYVLVSSKLTENPYGKEVTANPAGSGTWDHCCDGGAWKINYTWKFPASLIPGKPFSISMALKTASVVPSQPLADQMTALAPDFRQDLTTNYPGQPANAKTYTVPFSNAYKTDPNNKEIKLYVGFAHATVVFTYRRVGG